MRDESQQKKYEKYIFQAAGSLVSKLSKYSIIYPDELLGIVADDPFKKWFLRATYSCNLKSKALAYINER